MMSASMLALLIVMQADTFPPITNSEKDKSPVTPPASSLAKISLPAGFKSSLFAAEPMVQNPIAGTFDERGRLWIAENFTYAENPIRVERAMRDRVIVLEDADQDGVADRRRVFLDTLQLLTSVEVGLGGVWLMCPPCLLFVPDQNGDAIPDGPPQIVLDGFTVSDASHHNFANGLKFGPDGWLYGRCGHSCPAQIGVPGSPADRRVPMIGGIWRYHPTLRIAEVLCHGTTNPWGHDWDQHGELFFINTVNGHLWHLMPGAHLKESGDITRNPHVYDRLDTIADHYHFDVKGGWQKSRAGKANDFGGGHAHSGAMIYQGTSWPKQFQHRLMTINFHGQRVNVERLDRTGDGYIGRHEPDQFISSDAWFRGIELLAGPDDSMYLLDWADLGECHENTGVHRTSGRIYKFWHDVKLPDGARPKFTKPMSLSHDSAVARMLNQHQRGEIRPPQLLAMLEDPDEHVRVWAIRLLTETWPIDTIHGRRPHAIYPDEPEITTALLKRAYRDESGLVRLTLTSTLQRMPIAHRIELARLLLARSEDADQPNLPKLAWYGLMAVGQEQPSALVELVDCCRLPATTRLMTRFLAEQWVASVDAIPRTRDAAQRHIATVLSKGIKLPIQLRHNVLLGLHEGLAGVRQLPMPADWKTFSASITLSSEIKPSPALERASAELDIVFGDGRALADLKKVAVDAKADPQARKYALQTLLKADPSQWRGTCEQLLGDRELNLLAARALARFDDPAIAQLLIKRFRQFSVPNRPAMIELLVSRRSFAKELLEHLAAGGKQLAASDIQPTHARQIQQLGDPSLTEMLTKYWGRWQESDLAKQTKIGQFRLKLTVTELAKADKSAGRILFQKTCANCHKLFGEGTAIGPDLTGSQRSNLDYLLENLLEPAKVVPASHLVSLVSTKDGRQLTGIITERATNFIKLQTPTNLVTLPIREIENTQATNQSLMPDNQLDQLSREEVRDLIGYLMSPIQVPLKPDARAKQ